MTYYNSYAYQPNYSMQMQYPYTAGQLGQEWFTVQYVPVHTEC